jgi:hypothetical protein
MGELEASQQPGSSRRAEPQVSDDKLEKWHQLLVENYVRILREVSELHPLGGRGYRNEQWGGDWSVARGFVRLFCEAHIRRQLTVLSRTYQLQRAVKSLSKCREGFLEEAHDSCQRILDAIPARQRVKLFLATVSPVALGLFVATLGVENVYEAAVKVASSEFRTRIGGSLQSNILIGYSLLAVIYLLVFFAGSFAYKRGMFFPAVRYREASKWSRRWLERNRQLRNLKQPSDGINVYAIEDDLYAELNFPKPREPLLDVLITIGTVVPGLVAWSLYAATAGREEEFSAILFFSVVFGIIGVGAIVRTLQVARRRKCR